MNESEVHSKIRIWEDAPEDTPEDDRVLKDGGFEIEKVERIISVWVEKRVLVREDGWTVDSNLGLYQCWATIMWPQNGRSTALPFWTNNKDIWQVRPVSVIWTKDEHSKQLWDVVFNSEDKGLIRKVISRFNETWTDNTSPSHNVVIDRFGRFIIS